MSFMARHPIGEDQYFQECNVSDYKVINERKENLNYWMSQCNGVKMC